MNRLGFEVPSVGSNPVRHGRRNPRVSNEAVFEVEDVDLGRMGRARLLWDPTPLNPHPRRVFKLGPTEGSLRRPSQTSLGDQARLLLLILVS